MVLLSSWTWVRPFCSLFSPFLGALIIYDLQGFIIFDQLPIALERERERDPDSDPQQIWSRRLEWAIITRWLEIVDLAYSKALSECFVQRVQRGREEFHGVASRRVIKWTVGDDAKWKCVQF